MDFSDYLRFTRLFHGLTQHDFAHSLSFCQSTISEVENKRKTASDRLRASVSRYYPRTPEFDAFLIEIKRSE